MVKESSSWAVCVCNRISFPGHLSGLYDILSWSMGEVDCSGHFCDKEDHAKEEEWKRTRLEYEGTPRRSGKVYIRNTYIAKGKNEINSL